VDRRTILALVLVAAVIVLMPRLFPGRSRVVPQAGDTTAVPAEQGTPAQSEKAPHDSTVAQLANRVPGTGAPVAAPGVPADTITVVDSVARYRFISTGGTLQDVELRRYRALSRGDGSMVLRTPSAPLLRFRAVAARDTVRFDEVAFSSVGIAVRRAGESVEMRSAIGSDSLTLSYAVVPDSFLIHVTGTVSARLASEAGGFILMDLPRSLQSFEADTGDDQRHLAFAFMPSRGDAEGIGFGKLDPGERRVVPGPHRWVAVKNKYFIVGVLAGEGEPIAELSVSGLPRTSRIATDAQGTAVLRAVGGQFSLDVYTGPQQWKRLQSLGRRFETSNPYGGFMQPVVQPFATLVLRVLLWMHETLKMTYGWVLVVFGVAVRLVLWPLNQTAMRSSMKMQRVQPELNELQKRYKGDPQKLQAEMMRVYREHGMSPFSMFSGCLPLLIPMPVLFALFFVFQSTIEFRGVAFMWLTDISQKDPYYALPIAMGISMYVLTWIGSRNTPPNPQTKMMGYVFPVMMTFLLANLAAGLNLYYAVQNVAALPQQWLIANERARAGKAKK